MFESRMKRIYEATSVKTDAELASVLGIKPPSVAGARKRLAVPGDWIEKIAKDFQISADWLLFGRGPMRPGDTSTESRQSPMPLENPEKNCPRCAKLEAELEEERRERRDVGTENRKLWSKISDLKDEKENLVRENEVLRGQLKRISGGDVAADTA